MAMRRRDFLGGLSAGLLGHGLLRAAPRSRNAAYKTAPKLANSARNLIFVFLEGAPSHVDTFDLKTGLDTPDFLGAADPGNGHQWPMGTLPGLAQRLNQFSLVRSINAVEAVHFRATYHLMTAHRQNAALVKEIPHFASLLSYKMAAQRQPGDSLPTVMMIGENPAGNGFLPLAHLGLKLADDGRIQDLEHPYSGDDARFTLLSRLEEMQGPATGLRHNHQVFQKQAREMMLDGELKRLLGAGEEEPTDTVAARFRSQCETAVRVIAANRGTRVFQLSLSGWDHHVGIYNENDPTGLANLSRALDEGVSHLLDELAATPAVTAQAGNLLDETLIVVMGEFGRTTGRLNTSAGRDHFPYVVPALFAGGGTIGGRIIGASNEDGSYIVDPGWSQNRFMAVNDVLATIYSALGIDWTERFEETPSGRVFDMVDPTISGPAFAIDTLFS